MQPKVKEKQSQMEMFERELENLVRDDHPLVKLGRVIDWSVFDEKLGATYDAKTGAPGVNTRLMVALHYLKYQHDLSDDAVVEHWRENIYWQHFSGEQYLQHDAPIDPSSMTRWRKRLGKDGAELMLKQTIDAGMKIKAITPTQLKRVNIDTTVQTKAIRYPTDAHLADRARKTLVKIAKKEGLKIKQSYEHTGPKLVQQASRYAHARQPNRAAACTRKLRTHLGRIIREIERQNSQPTGKLAQVLAIAKRIQNQQRNTPHKVYSVHEPHVHCIAKGKAGKKYEFGNKVSVAVTSHGGWLIGTLSLAGNPYDGHTLAEQLAQVRRLAPEAAKEVYVDMGYRGHGYEGEETIYVDKRRRGNTPKPLWKRMKRRAAVEPTIGHCKNEHRMDRNRLKGEAGDTLNALLSAASMNFQKLLGAFFAQIIRLFLRLLFGPSLRPSAFFDPQVT